MTANPERRPQAVERFCSRLFRFLAGCACACPLAETPAEADPYVVSERRAVLYEGRIVKHELPRGEMVEATLHPTDREWLNVQYQGRVYDAAGQQFQGRDAALEALRRKAEAGQEKADILSRKMAAHSARALQLWYAVNAVRFDSTILYKITVRPAQGAMVLPGAAAEKATPTYIPASFRYDDKIEPGRAKRLIKEWQTELTGLEKELQQWRAGRRTQLQVRIESDIGRDQLESRFRQFAAGSHRAGPEPYVVTGTTPVVFFQERLRKTQVEPDTVVLATPHPADPAWLRVQFKQQEYDASAKPFLSRSTEEMEYRLRTEIDEERLRELAGEITDCEQRDTFLASLQLALKYESNLTRYPLAAHPVTPAFPGRRLYNVPMVPSGVVEIVDTSRAKRVLKDWDTARAALHADIAARENEQNEIRRRSSSREQRHHRLQEKFNQLAVAPAP